MLRMIIRRLLGAARFTTMRMQQSIPSAGKPAHGLAADPKRFAVRTWSKKTQLEPTDA
jgi:hypothetical protein